MIKKYSFLMLFFIPFYLFSQSELLNTDDLDSLFDFITEEPVIEDEPELNVLTDVINETGLTFSATYQLYTGYTTGYINGGWIEGSYLEETLDDSTLMAMNSTFKLDAQISNNFRVFQSWGVNYPNFDLTIKEFFADSTLFDTVYLRFGKQNISWGESKFGFTNLPARVPDDFTGSTDAYSMKLSLPIGIGGLSLLAITKVGLWEDETAPASDEIAYGGQFNYILGIQDQKIDITAGILYYKDLNTRAHLSLTTTIFDNWEIFTEGLISYNQAGTTFILDDDKLDMENYDNLNNEPELIDNYLDISANIGIYTDFFDGKLEVGGEYYFNGEETELYAGKTYPLFHGHNFLLSSTFNLEKINSEISATLLYHNDDENVEPSGLFTPVIIWDITEDFMLSIASPLYFGDLKGEYLTNNKDPLDRDWSIIIRLIFHGDI